MAKVIVGEHLDYTWEEEKIEVAIEMSLDGYNINQIAQQLNRDFIETAILIDELLYIKRIPIKNNLLGPRKESNDECKVLSTG